MKPMLAVDYVDLIFPLLASPKLDGIRCVIYNGVSVSRSLKKIPNKHISNTLSNKDFEDLDGELIIGEPNDITVFNKTCSIVSSFDKVFDFSFYVFDLIDKTQTLTYVNRLELLKQRVNDLKIKYPFIKLVEQTLINNQEEFDTYEKSILELGYEGVMVRSLNGIYKYGRCTAKENNLLRVKRFTDDEAIVIGYEELMINTNEKVTNELGRSERSSKLAGLVSGNKLGAIIVKDIKTGVTFNIGSGFNDSQRIEYWNGKEKLINRLITYKYFPIGVIDKPRFPVFKGFRLEIDT
jgi:DNA ligase-1